MRCMRPAWRISTYSSRLEQVMARNLTRSSRGLVESSASSRTRRLNCIQDASRPLKRRGLFDVLAMQYPYPTPCWQSTAFGPRRVKKAYAGARNRAVRFMLTGRARRGVLREGENAKKQGLGAREQEHSPGRLREEMPVRHFVVA